MKINRDLPMIFRNVIFCAYFFVFFLHGAASANITSGWEKPFLETIRKLKANEWQRSKVSKKDFVKLSMAALKHLKKNRDQWTVFFDQKNNIGYSDLFNDDA